MIEKSAFDAPIKTTPESGLRLKMRVTSAAAATSTTLFFTRSTLYFDVIINMYIRAVREQQNQIDRQQSQSQ